MTKPTPNACTAALQKHLDPELFKALGDSNRLALIARLAGAAGPVTVSDAADCCGVHLSGVSRHLSQLRQAGVVDADKRGREVVYRLNTTKLVKALRSLADAIEECCEQSNCC